MHRVDSVPVPGCQLAVALPSVNSFLSIHDSRIVVIVTIGNGRRQLGRVLHKLVHRAILGVMVMMLSVEISTSGKPRVRALSKWKPGKMRRSWPASATAGHDAVVRVNVHRRHVRSSELR